VRNTALDASQDKRTLAAEPSDLSSVSMRHEPPTEAVRVELEVP